MIKVFTYTDILVGQYRNGDRPSVFVSARFVSLDGFRLALYSLPYIADRFYVPLKAYYEEAELLSLKPNREFAFHWKCEFQLREGVSSSGVLGRENDQILLDEGRVNDKYKLSLTCKLHAGEESFGFFRDTPSEVADLSEVSSLAPARV